MGITTLRAKTLDREQQGTWRGLDDAAHFLLHVLRHLDRITGGLFLDETEKLGEHPHSHLIRDGTARRNGLHLLL